MKPFQKTLFGGLASIVLLACGAAAPVSPTTPAPRAPAAPSPSAIPDPAPATTAPLVDEPFLGTADTKNARSHVATHPFKLADLPLADLPEPLPPASAPASLPQGEEATELAFDWGTAGKPSAGHRGSARITIKTTGLGKLRVGFNEGAVSGKGAGGVYVACGGAEPGPRRPVAARWETVAAIPESPGKTKYTVTNAWFDLADCKAVVVARTSVVAVPLANGYLFGYRQTCNACGSGEALVLLAPRATHIAATATGGDSSTSTGIFSRVHLPLRKGAGASLMMTVVPEAFTDWPLTGAKQNDLAPGPHLVGLDVTQGVADAETTAIAYEGAVAGN